MLKFMLVVVLFAALVYAIVRTIERRRTLGPGDGPGKGRGRGLPKRKPPPPTQVAPDDDEDFLRWLDRKRQKDGRDGREGQGPATPTD